MIKAYQFRIYPTPEQELQIRKTIGCCRFVYNHYRAAREEAYKANRKAMTYNACSKDMTSLKKAAGTEWLREVNATALQSSLKDLDAAYKRFFDGRKTGRQVGYPKFRSKRGPSQSFRIVCNRNKNGVGDVAVLDHAVKIPSLGIVKCAVSRKVEGRILSVTVRMTPSGRFYASFCCDNVDIAPLPRTDKCVGVDLGLKSYAVTSDGQEFENPKHLSKLEKKLAKEQRRLSRKTKGSKRYLKQRIKVARVHERIADQRLDMQHKLSTKLVRENDVICIEDLAPKNMVQNHKLAKSISDAAWGEFRRQLEYKAAWYGKEVVVIDRFYPSSQLCSTCGGQWPGTKDLSVREWTCPHCGVRHDRDVNAAINILNEGMRMLNAQAQAA